MLKTSLVNNIHIIDMPQSIGKQEVEQFKTDALAWVDVEASAHVLRFSNTVSIDVPFYQALIQFRANLKAKNIPLFSLDINSNLSLQIKTDGLYLVFCEIPSLEDLTTKALGIRKERSAIDIHFLNPFIKGTTQALKVQANTPVEIGKPYIKAKDRAEGYDIVGILTLISVGFSGSLALCFSKEVFLQIYKNMFDETHVEITKDIEDAAGELLNIIYGIAKVDLNNAGYNFQKALPTVIKGKDLNVKQGGSLPIFVVPFSMGKGNFFLEVESSI